MILRRAKNREVTVRFVKKNRKAAVRFGGLRCRTAAANTPQAICDHGIKYIWFRTWWKLQSADGVVYYGTTHWAIHDKNIITFYR